MPRNRKSAREIAEQAMPGWKSVERPAADPDAPAFSDAHLPPLEDLRRKYLGDSADALSEYEAAEAPRDVDSGAVAGEIVTLESGPLRRNVGIEGGEVKWRQG
jgi:hypothetical protein